MSINSIQEFIQKALEEDIGEGDHTSLACIPNSAIGKAHLLVKQNGIIAGVELADEIFKHLDPTLNFIKNIKDGEKVTEGDIAFTIQGKTQSILSGERLVLNCMQRMSGIATYTHETQNLLKGLKAKVLDTRKTTPCFRMMEKWAVKIGGGENHRIGLYDMIMIKDNHIDFKGGIKPAIQATKDYLEANNKKLKICIEARSLSDVKDILKVGLIDRIMLDNFSPKELKNAIEVIDNQFETEATGGITKKNIKDYAQSGVDFISMGALTHSAGSLDLSLKAVN